MTTRQEIETKLEEELGPKIKEAVELYRGELEMQAAAKGPLGHSPKQIEEMVRRREEEIKKELMRPHERDEIQHGFDLLMEKIEALPEKAQVEKEFEEASNRYESIKDQIGTGPSVQDLLGISKETYDLFYAIAFNLFRENYESKESLKDVVSILRYLTGLNEYVFEPHLLLGYALQTLEDYEGAIRAYTAALELKPEEFEPNIRIVECDILLGKSDEAKDKLDQIEKDGCTANNLEIVQTMRRSL